MALPGAKMHRRTPSDEQGLQISMGFREIPGNSSCLVMGFLGQGQGNGMLLTGSLPVSGPPPQGAFNNALLILKQMEKCFKRCQVYLWKHETAFKRCALPVGNVKSPNRKCALLPIYFIAVSAAQSWGILPLRNYLFSNSWTRTSWPSLCLSPCSQSLNDKHVPCACRPRGTAGNTGNSGGTLCKSLYFCVDEEAENSEIKWDGRHCKLLFRIMKKWLTLLLYLKTLGSNPHHH